MQQATDRVGEKALTVSVLEFFDVLSNRAIATTCFEKIEQGSVSGVGFRVVNWE